MRGRRHKLQVSTFPFLAVLLCAMGSLILVLLVMDRKAHKAAQARAQREAARLVEESAREESTRQAERDQLKQQALKEWEDKREVLHEKLTKEQIELQLQMRKVREEMQGIAARLHYEQDTTTQLRHKSQNERSRLQAEEQLLRTLRSNAKLTEDQSKESSQALRRMTLDLLQMEQALKDLKASKQREQKTFSVVPYHGRRGENRRPLYVECTADGIIFHPERKAMSITALIPGSRDSGSEVRAEVERRITQQRQKLAGLPNNVDKTPYLLLLLRPGGVTTYHYFQRALRGLPLDFGYEFIDEDWVLDFPADDELPSTQPWMVASNTPSRPAVAPAVVASPPPRTSPRPMGGAPTGSSVAAFSNGIHGFRASEGGGNGTWAKGDGLHPESPASSIGGGSGGSGPGMPGGSGLGGSGSGMPGGSGIAASQAGPGNQTMGSATNLFGSPNGFGSPIATASGRPGSASGSGGVGTGLGRGTGHGHPSAMPPTFANEDGGEGYSGDGVASGSGRGAIVGLYPLRGPSAGSGTGPGFPADGSSVGRGSDLPGLGPPRALASGPGEGYGSGGTAPNAIAGAGSIGNGNGVPGNGWVGGGRGLPGVPGSAPGMGTSAGGRSVIARGNNGSDASGPGIMGGGDDAGTGGSAIASTFGSGGYTPGTSMRFGPDFGAHGGGGPSTGTQDNVGGSPGGQGLVGTPMPGALGSGGPPSSGTSINNSAYSGTQGAGGSYSGSGQAMNGAGGALSTGGSPIASASGNSGPSPYAAPTNSGAGSGMQGVGGNTPGSGQAMNGGGGANTSGTATPGAFGSPGSPTSQPNIVSNPGMQGSGNPSQGAGASSSGGPIVIGGTPNGQAPAGGTPSPNGSRSSDVVIYVDPLTGKPTDAPRPAAQPNDGPSEGPPPQQADGYRSSPRVRVVPATGAASGGGSDEGEDQSPGMNRFMPPPSYAPPPPRRIAAPRPGWIHGGRDWTIYVECRADQIVLYPSEKTFTLAQATSGASGNPLVKEIQQMIDRRQSSLRPGEPSFHPQVCLLVRPEHFRTFLTVYPALEALPVPRTRRKLDADDDVISIVTGAVP